MYKILHYYNSNFLYAKRESAVLVGGCFDLLHYGHIQFLKKAKSCGKNLIIALEPDIKIIKNKSRVPVHNQIERAEILEALHFVDQVLLLPELNTFDEYLALVMSVKPSVIALTQNDPQIKNKMLQAEKIGAKLEIVTDRIPNFSSTQCISNVN